MKAMKALTTPASRREHLRSMLADLKMPGALEALDPILQGIDGGTLTAAEALEELLSAQITLLGQPPSGGRPAPQGRLPAVKTLSEFDFTFQPSINRQQTSRACTNSASSSAGRT